MDFVSYSSDFEDVVLWRVFKDVKLGFYIDVGAKGPTLDSATKALYEAGWSGINIELNSKCHELFVRRRPRDINLRVLVGEMPNEVTSDNDKGEIPADGQTLEFIWQEHVPEGEDVHFLRVGVGERQYRVISSNNWTQNRPWVIVIFSSEVASTAEKRADWEDILIQARYRMVHSEGKSKFYLAEEHTELTDFFAPPPAVFQHIRPYGVHDLELELQVANEQREKLRKKLQFTVDSIVSLVQEAKVIRTDLEAVYRSLSWRLTQPLRQFNPKRILFFAIPFLRDIVSRSPAIANTLRPLIHKMPFVHGLVQKACGVGGHDEQSGFVNLTFRDIVIDFSSGPLGDKRGIGRVAREQLAKLREREIADFGYEVVAGGPRKLHFYSSIHWCPHVLPEKSVIMIHDVIPLIFYEIFPKSLVWEWEGRLKSAAAQAEHIVTISHANLEKISDLLEVDKRKISVVYNGVTRLPVDENCRLDLPKKPFLVLVGSYDYHKNVEIVLQAMREPVAKDVELALVGDNSAVLSRAKKLGVHNRLRVLGRCSDGELGYALSKSSGLVFPSLYEGFGLPPMEAALLEVPSICSDKPAMNEILNNGVIFCDPMDPKQWADAMCLLTGTGLPQADLEKARRYVEIDFNWDRSVDDLLQILRRVASNDDGRRDQN